MDDSSMVYALWDLSGEPVSSPRVAIGLLAALVLPVLVATFAGASGPRSLRLNLGPGDGPYVRGFSPSYEIDEGVALHWTTRRAAVALPLEVRGGPATLVYRFAPPPVVGGEEAEIEVLLGERVVDHYTIGRVTEFQERTVELAALGPMPLEVGFSVRSGDPRNLGLWLDWLRLDLGVASRSVLLGPARWRPGLVVALLFSLLFAAGWTARGAALLSAPLAIFATVCLRLDPWLLHRLLTGVPEALLAFGLVVVAGAGWLRRRGKASDRDVRWVVALVLLTFLLRALALNTPGYYHPDLRSHALLALAVREGGARFFLEPSSHLARLETWYRPVLGGLTFPYTPAFHVPFALSGAAYDQVVTAMKLAAAALSVVPIALTWGLTRRLGVSPLGAFLLSAAPIYGVHLAVAYGPALLGHCADLAFLCWLAWRRNRIRQPAVWLAATVWVAVCQLAYVTAVVILPVFLGALAVAEGLEDRREGMRRALAILGSGVVGSILAVILYYRDFVGPILRGLRHIGPASGEPAPGFFSVAAYISRSNFGLLPLALAVVGVALLFRWGTQRTLLAAWLSAYGLILVGRSLAPAVFGHQHEALFVAPLLFIAMGVAVARIWEGGRALRPLAVVMGLGLAAAGLHSQWEALMRQLVYAR